MAGLLSKPMIIVAYSLGGVVARSLLMEAMSDKERANVKGVIFVASPINGSDQAEVIKDDLKPFITPFVPFLDNFTSSFTTEEFSNHFFDAGFSLSNASKPY